MKSAKNGGGFVSIGKIAERDGVSSMAISKIVKRLCERHNLNVIRTETGRVTGVDVRHYDQLRAKFGDSTKKRGRPSKAPAPTDGISLDSARTAKLVEEIRLARLKVATTTSALVRVDRVEDAADRLAEEIAMHVDVTQHLDDLISAYNSGGLPAARSKAKAVNQTMRSRISDACSALARSAADYDEAVASEEEEGA